MDFRIERLIFERYIHPHIRNYDNEEVNLYQAFLDTRGNDEYRFNVLIQLGRNGHISFNEFCEMFDIPILKKGDYVYSFSNKSFPRGFGGGKGMCVQTRDGLMGDGFEVCFKHFCRVTNPENFACRTLDAVLGAGKSRLIKDLILNNKENFIYKNIIYEQLKWNSLVVEHVQQIK